MRAVPDFLPAATSRKWHNRRWWDGLGHVRVRTLANPRWQRDVPWLRRILDFDAAHESSDNVRLALRNAARMAARYPKDATGRINPDQAWDDVLAAIDAALAVRQAEHLAAVRAGGCSGI